MHASTPFRIFLGITAAAVFTVASVRADTLYVVSSAAGSIGTYSSVSGTAINASLVTGLTTPEAMAFDPSLNFYVTGFTAEYVRKYTNNGTLISSLAQGDPENPTFIQPGGIAVNGAGEIFVVNNALMNGETSVSKFTADGTIVNTNFVNAPGSPLGALVEPSGDLYVVRWAESAVGKYTSSGTSGTVINDSFLSPGAAINTWRPYNVARDSQGYFYVTGAAPYDDVSMVSKFAANGTLVNANLITLGAESGTLYGLAIDSQDNIFVGTYGGTTIGKYHTDGSVVNASFITGVPSVTNIAVQPVSVPEPATIAMALAGVAWGGISMWRRRVGAPYASVSSGPGNRRASTSPFQRATASAIEAFTSA